MMNSTPNNPIITRYLHNNTLSSSRTQGRKIFKKGNYKLKRFDASKEKVIYEVQNDAKSHNYTVTINDYANTSSPIKAHCTCLYSLGGICKHRVAVLLALDQILFEQEDDTQSTLYNQSNTVVYMENIDESIIRAAASKQDWIIAQQLAENNRATIITDETQTATANLPTAEQSYKVIIQKEGEEKFITSCGCKENRFKLCMHKVAIFLQIKMQQGIWAFDLMKNWDEFKNNLLHPYGFSLNDDLSGKFTFKMGERTPELVLLDESIVPLADLETWGAKYRPKTPEQRTINVDEIMPRAIINKKNAANKFVLAYAFQFWGEESQLPGFAFTPIVGKLSTEENKIISHVAPLLNTYGNIETKNLPEINPKDLQLLQLSKEMSWSSVGEVARTNFANKAKHTYKGTGGYYVYAESLQDNELQIIQQYVLQKLKRAFVALKNKRIFHLKNSGKKISINNLVPLTLSMDKVKLHFSVHEIDDFVELSAKLKIRDQFLEIKDAQLISSFMLLNNNTLYLLDLDEDPQILRLFTKTPVIKVRVQEVGALIKNLIIPLQSKYTVDTYISIDIAQRYITPKAELYLKEDEDYLVFQPILNYKGWQVELDGVEEIVFEEDGSIIKIVRDRFYEEDFLRFLLQQHPYFEEQYAENNGLFFYLPYDEIMEQMWFLNFFDALRENYIELFGFKSLHHFRYNINKPEVEFRVSSGIDWFDIEAEIQFGNQTVSLKEVQKALLRNERFVKLGDGTLGVLPENWLKKYATLFKMGSLQGNNKLQVSKVHFSLVDELYEEIPDETIQVELLEKKSRLKDFTEIKEANLPSNVTATLRDYQKSGFQWLNFLDEFKWGGCLADDMGLGKTLQVLAFLQHQKEKYGKQTSLVVGPTSLMFNWETEITKFCPDLTSFRHHGTNRNRFNTNHFTDYDIIITSYGTMAADADLFSKFHFNYIVLDESQAIKNPTTKRYKAARLLKANNRLALTGTPIENNTFDLFAQLNFLNPGMLGSLEFFKKEFANPIDKLSSKEKVEELKKIIYPFFLRRTKELVARELPAKTETVLFCEMGKKQRKVYDAFKNEYRFKIMSKIEEEGMAKAGVYILEGLMKLRQICDSPAILKNAEDYGNDSVKLDELVNNITQKTGNHKILVFSQFLGMLGLLRKALENFGIDYAYLDGSTSANGRKNAVEKFQTDLNCRVFLLSLKAGNTGLNLTAADYVYLVDPWWNPAVEQQAIDRTHRIGQTKKVFAYRMICKDSVEEKIMTLQARKRALASDLISADAGFLKKLNKDDIAYLFS